jgi:phospholipid-translocating ATPase
LLVGVGRSAATSPTPVPPEEDVLFRKMVGVSYTVLVLNELAMVGVEITTWHPIMIISILGTGVAFFGSLPFLGEYVELSFVVSVGFVWRVALILAVALVPIYAGKVVGRVWRPSSYRKVRGT